MEITDRLLVCVNLLDEAERRHIDVDLKQLERQLGVPVVGTSAGSGQGLKELQERLRNLSDGFTVARPNRLDSGEMNAEEIASALNRRASEIAKQSVRSEKLNHSTIVDRIALGKWSGRLILLLLLFAVFWITIQGANYPSKALQTAFDALLVYLKIWCNNLPFWLQSFLLDGIYMTVTRVVSVMLPPMAIFFPLFTILEDFGYLPRAAFLMDRGFQRCGGCGKQVLTMAMGFGCNAVGVMGCRIISSPKERLLAIVTNSLVPCNGRFPAMITLIGLFFADNGLCAALILTAFVLFSVGMTFLSSALLNRTVLNNQDTRFVLELPPYRRPKFVRIIVRSLLDRTAFVLGRAVSVAVPAGAVIWALQNITVEGTSLLLYIARWLHPAGLFLGMNGVILLAFILSFPANELLLPLVVMILHGGYLQETSALALGEMLHGAGWTAKTALCVLVFILFHWPCGTTLLTVRRESGSWAWTALSAVLPTCIGILCCRLIVCIF